MRRVCVIVMAFGLTCSVACRTTRPSAVTITITPTATCAHVDPDPANVVRCHE